MKGLALLVVIGVLGVLAVLGTAFVTLVQLERRASEQRANATRALLLARSGLEDALARLSAGQDPGFADLEACPVRQALRPSFFVGAGGTPATLPVDGRPRGYSGALMASAGGRNAYSLKVEDESAKINVNGGFLDSEDRDGDGIPDFRDPFVADLTPAFPAGANGIGRGFNGQLARILGILVQQPELNLPALPTAGTDILLNRPLGGYRSLAQVQAALGMAVDLSPWLTVSSWVDAKVVHPNGYPGEIIPETAWSELKKARLPLRLEEAGRPPVNLNAASRPVLVALIQGLRGNSWHGLFPFPHVYEIPPALAAQVADAIAAFRSGKDPFPGWASDPNRPLPGPLSSWGDFSGFCDGLVPTLISGMVLTTRRDGGDLGGAALLKANFDPNTHLNKQAPDELMLYWVDKSDLNVWSTEGSLYPTGTFTVACVGRVLGADGRLLAERVLTGAAQVFSLLRQTSQKDFTGGRKFQDYLSYSSDETQWRTTGASDPSWKAGMKPAGMAVMTYPCPPTAVRAGNAADFDGAIALSTVESRNTPPQGAAAQPFFLHHFDDAWDAGYGVGSLVTPGPSQAGYPASDEHLQTDPAVSVWPDLGQEPSTLYPDGAHAQNGRSPAYSTANFPSSLSAGDPYPSNHGTISYWLKSFLQSGTSMSSGGMTSWIHFSCIHPGATDADTQVLMAGQNRPLLGMVMENSDSGDGPFPLPAFERAATQHLGASLLRQPGLRWMLVTLHFDTDEAYGQGYDMHCDVRAFPQDMSPDPLSYTAPFDLSHGLDLFGRAAAFIVGSQLPYNTNQVMDELALCDFGDVGSVALQNSTDWTTARYQDGRYYKGDDGAFLSSVLDLGGDARARLLSARWTEYLPRESRQEAVSAPWGYPARKVDPTLALARLELDLLPPGAVLQGAALKTLGQGASIGLPLPSFRYRVRFRTEGITPSDPVLETPWFDDITFAWQGASGPRVLSWGAP